MAKKTAVILMNLGGPDKLSSVKEFLFNLFYDKAIITLPNPFRWILAKFISGKREKTAQEIYQRIGGSSPILAVTKRQAEILEEELNKQKDNFKVFVSMRYWHPFASEVIKDLEEFAPDEIILLPLYPQYSTTTSKSSIDEFTQLLKKSNLNKIKIKSICCYYQNPNFIKAHVDLIKKETLKIKDKFRILFSAHGLPEYIIKAGDPYQWQVEQTVNQILKELNQDLDYVVCYQSKVGSLKWITPSTEEELEKAAKEDISVVIVPIAFVSDHSETLVELDIEYKELFEKNSNKTYIRVAALNENKDFILSLVDQVLEKTQVRKCPKEFCKCFKEKENG
jgi:ferrochelatase